jgi:hypothetical protein
VIRITFFPEFPLAYRVLTFFVSGLTEMLGANTHANLKQFAIEKLGFVAY